MSDMLTVLLAVSLATTRVAMPASTGSHFLTEAQLVTEKVGTNDYGGKVPANSG